MGNNINNVIVGKPAVTGGVSIAPLGTTLPSDARSALAVGFTATGYITDAGLVKSEKRNTGTIAAWGGDIVAATRKGTDITFKLDLAEFLNGVVQGLMYGDANVATTAATASLAAPVLSAPSTATTGGTLLAATYAYTATYTNASGETVASNAVSQTTTGSASTVTFTIGTAPSGATGTKIYRGGVLLDTLATTPTTYTDTGAKTPGTATAPVANSTGSGTRLKITATSAPTPKKVWVFDVFSDAAKVRIVVPIGRVMDVGDTTFKDDQIAAAATTIQAFPDSTGAFFYVYTDDGVTL